MEKSQIRNTAIIAAQKRFTTSVPDPDHPDPHVLGLPDPSIIKQKIVRKTSTLIPTVLSLLVDLLSLNDVNVPSKSTGNKQQNFF
jgi:hypothetical protein